MRYRKEGRSDTSATAASSAAAALSFLAIAARSGYTDRISLSPTRGLPRDKKPRCHIIVVRLFTRQTRREGGVQILATRLTSSSIRFGWG